MQMSKCLMQSHILMWVRNRIYTHAHRLTDTKNARNELTFNSDLNQHAVPLRAKTKYDAQQKR